MKKLIALFWIVAGIQTSLAQSHSIDSIKTALARHTDPKERFTATIQYLENEDSYKGGLVDSAICIDLLQIAQHLDSDSLLAISYDWIGYYFYQSKGDNTTAIEYFFKALPLAKQFNDKRRISSLYFDLAGVYFWLKNIDAFYNYTKKGGEYLPDKTSPKYDYMLVQYQRNLGTAYMEKAIFDSALYYGQAALQTGERLNLKLFKFQAFNLLGSVYAKMNEIELADVYFNKALALCDDVLRDTKRLGFYQRYISFLIQNNRMAEAKEQTDKVWAMAGVTENLNFKMVAATYKKQLFDKLNNTDSAYHYSKIESGLRELIFNQNSQNALQALTFKEQLRGIEEEAQREEEAHQRRINIQYAIIALGIITLLILYLLLSRSFITNTKLIEFFGVIALLIVFEFLNLLLHPFLERVTHHSPLLMLLALVCIAALLVPLHHKVEKWATAKLVEKNKQIRLAAAKKTIQQLGADQGE